MNINLPIFGLLVFSSYVIARLIIWFSYYIALSYEKGDYLGLVMMIIGALIWYSIAADIMFKIEKSMGDMDNM